MFIRVATSVGGTTSVGGAALDVSWPGAETRGRCSGTCGSRLADPFAALASPVCAALSRGIVALELGGGGGAGGRRVVGAAIEDLPGLIDLRGSGPPQKPHHWSYIGRLICIPLHGRLKFYRFRSPAPGRREGLQEGEERQSGGSGRNAWSRRSRNERG